MKNLGIIAILAAVLPLTSSSLPLVKDGRLRVYVLDTYVSSGFLNRSYICGEARRNHTQLGEYDNHADNVTEIIGRSIDTDRYCVYPVTVLSKNKGRFVFLQEAYIRALYRIHKDPLARGLNLSMAGPDVVKGELSVIRSLLRKGTKVVVSAGNDSKILRVGSCGVFPACFKLLVEDRNFIVVSSVDFKKANKVRFPHVVEKGYKVGHSVKLTGTSQAAAVHTGRLFSKGE